MTSAAMIAAASPAPAGREEMMMMFNPHDHILQEHEATWIGQAGGTPLE
jgi:hypothetical protein